MLPRLLTEAAAATHGAAASETGRAADLASQVHRITASTLLHLGATDLGYTAAREALRLAALTSDPLRAAAARNTLGHVLLRQGRFVDAERVAVATAEGMQPPGDASTAHLFGVRRGAAARGSRRSPAASRRSGHRTCGFTGWAPRPLVTSWFWTPPATMQCCPLCACITGGGW
ncbi:MAG: hypothetical protein ACRDRI_06260 [Pseudonocardiaceae bacterium]